MLAHALLTKAASLSPLELVDGLNKCQQMAIRAALLPSKAPGTKDDPLVELRRQYFGQFATEPTDLLQEGAEHEDEPESLQRPDAAAGQRV